MVLVVVAAAAVTWLRRGDDAAAGDKWLPEVPTEVNELFEIELPPGEIPHSVVGERDRVIVFAGPPGESSPRAVSVYDGDGSLQHQFDVVEGVGSMMLVDDFVVVSSFEPGEVRVYGLDGAERWRHDGGAMPWGGGSILLLPSSIGTGAGTVVAVELADLDDGTVLEEFSMLGSGIVVGPKFHVVLEGDDVHVRNTDFETVFTWRDADLAAPGRLAIQFDGERLYTAASDVLSVHDGDDVTKIDLPGEGGVTSMSLIEDMLIVSRYDPNGPSLATAYRIDASGDLDESWSTETDSATTYGGLISLYGADSQVLWPDGTPVNVAGQSDLMYVVGPTTVRSDAGIWHFDEKTREQEWQIETGPSSRVFMIDEAVAVYDDITSPPILQVYGEG